MTHSKSASKMTQYILLDFETTGLSPEKDEIIEIGALKMEGFEVIGRYEQLTKPSKPIPKAIIELTGITNEMVEDKPLFSDIAKDFADFLEDLPIVAHNSQMEQSFLDHHLSPLVSGIAYTVHNSIEPLALILPDQTSHSLESLRVWANVETENAHRALQDSEDLLKILKKASEICEKERSYIASLSHQFLQDWWWNWYFDSIFDRLDSTQNLFEILSRESLGSLREFQNADEERETPTFIDLPEEELNSIFDGGEKQSSQFQTRTSQKTMAHAVRSLFERGGKTAIEAPTGTGKSLGYLLPSMLATKATDLPIVIATHSKSLQDQLLDKDVPLSKKLSDQEYLQSTSVKGQENYLCLRKLYSHSLNLPEENSKSAIDERYAFVFLVVFSKVSKLAELDRVTPYLLQRIEGMSKLLERMRSHHQTTIGPKCPFYESCHFFNSARLAHQSQIIIANHSLVFHWPEHLPKIRQVIFDEAHHLEDGLTQTYSEEISEKDLIDTIERLRLSGKVKSWSDGAKVSGFLSSEEKLERYKILIEDVYEVGKEWGRLIPSLIQKHGTKESMGFEDFLNINTLKESPALNVLQKFKDKCNELVLFFEGELALKKEENKERTQAFDLVSQITSRLKDQIITFNRLLNFEELNDLKMILWHSKDSMWRMKVVPIDVSEKGKEFFEKTHSVVLTSATLSTPSQEDFYIKRIGLNLTKPLLKLPSPFKLEEQAKVYITPQVGNPGSAQHLAQIISFTTEAARILGGRTLVLFSANTRLKAAAEKLRENLEPHGITVFDSLTDKRAVEHFRTTPRSVLVGGERYGEGVDLPGEILSLVIIEKINEMMTRGPLAEARKSRVKFGLFEYDFPLRMTWLKQRVGRLIRTATDKGSIVIFEPRYFGWQAPSQNVVKNTIFPMQLRERTVDQILMEMEADNPFKGV